jgi:hypothetical protein
VFDLGISDPDISFLFALLQKAILPFQLSILFLKLLLLFKSSLLGKNLFLLSAIEHFIVLLVQIIQGSLVSLDALDFL